ncbi:MAG: enoyl-CoA hydratase/isomerase family protein, partial [Proteobacteria bacterium]|nr:enoyl-CoA hydratase/isomerase family protein [Pseudomonadota bacterium]
MNESSGKGTLLRRKEAGILTLTLNRPDRMNAINHDMFFAIARAAETAAVDPEVRVVVFTGAGSVFCSGGDITGLADRPAEAGGKEAYKRTFREIQGVFDKVEAIPQPTIAAINGHVLGGGLQLALACDFRIAVREAKFGLPDVKNGIIPGLGGTTRLPRLIGLAKA